MARTGLGAAADMSSTTELDLAVVGAGPYGVSLAASNPRLRSVVFGRPFETWERMDPAMQLRASSDEMSLSAGRGRGDLAQWHRAAGREPEEPMRVRTFLSYGDWFVNQFVPDLVPEDVVLISDAGRGRLAVESTGRRVVARSVAIS